MKHRFLVADKVTKSTHLSNIYVGMRTFRTFFLPLPLLAAAEASVDISKRISIWDLNLNDEFCLSNADWNCNNLVRIKRLDQMFQAQIRQCKFWWIFNIELIFWTRNAACHLSKNKWSTSRGALTTWFEITELQINDNQKIFSSDK